MSDRRISALLASTMVLGFSEFFALASAQETGADAEVNDAEEVSRQLPTVTVTARKREERLQDAPISITAFSPDDLEKRQITNVGQIADVTPNLTINTSASFSGSSSTPAIFLRGVGQVDFTLNTDPGVGVYVDGVYISRSVGALLDLVDIERIEVLRGPQGTLVGRNTIGGAINVTTAAPRDEFGGRLKATTGSDNRFLLQGSVDLPISESLLSRWSINYHTRDGYVDRPLAGDELGDDNSLSARGVIAFEPTEDVSFTLSVDYTDEDESAAPFILNEINPNAGFAAFHNAVIAPMLDPALALSDPMGPPSLCFVPTTNNSACFNEASVPVGQQGVNFGTLDAVSQVEVFGASLTSEFDFNGITLKSITAYRDLESFSLSENDAAPVAINSTSDLFEYEQFSQEVQLLGATPDDRFQWILGAFYFVEDGNNANQVNFAPIEIQSGGLVENKSTAVFAQATYSLTERLDITGGIRWTQDDREFTPVQFIRNDIAGMGMLNGVPVLPNTTASTDSSDVTPMVNIKYDWTDDISTYATYSEGFKSGGFTQRVFPPLPDIPSFNPESVQTFEVGLKSLLFDGLVQANAAAFTTDYSDLQVNVQRGIAPTTENAAAASIEGFELEVQATPLDGLLMNLGVGYTDAQYDELDASVVGVTIDTRLPGASDWTINAGVQYDANFGDLGMLTARADYAYRSEFFFDALNEVGEDGYDTLNLALTWSNAADTWQVSLFGTNVTDEVYALQGTSILDPGGFQQVLLARPAEWGLSVGFNF